MANKIDKDEFKCLLMFILYGCTYNFCPLGKIRDYLPQWMFIQTKLFFFFQTLLVIVVGGRDYAKIFTWKFLELRFRSNNVIEIFSNKKIVPVVRSTINTRLTLPQRFLLLLLLLFLQNYCLYLTKSVFNYIMYSKRKTSDRNTVIMAKSSQAVNTPCWKFRWLLSGLV